MGLRAQVLLGLKAQSNTQAVQCFVLDLRDTAS